MGEVRPRAAGTTVSVLDQLSIRRTFSPTLTYFPDPRRVISRFPPRPILPILSFTHRAGRETDPTSRDREGSRAGAAPAHQDNGRARVQLPIGDARDQDDRGARHNRFVCRGAGEHWRRVLTYLRANGFKTFVVSGGGVDFMRPWAERVYGIPPEQVECDLSVEQPLRPDGPPEVYARQHFVRSSAVDRNRVAWSGLRRAARSRQSRGSRRSGCRLPGPCLVGRVISRFRMFSQLPIVPARRAG